MIYKGMYGHIVGLFQILSFFIVFPRILLFFVSCFLLPDSAILLVSLAKFEVIVMELTTVRQLYKETEKFSVKNTVSISTPYFYYH